MHPDLEAQLAALPHMTVAQLRARYADLFGEPAHAGNKAWLRKRIAWRLQALAEGDLSQRARLRAAELAHDANLRLTPPQPSPTQPPAPVPGLPAPKTPTPDPRLPPPGTLLQRRYKGHTLLVTIRPHGFDFQGHLFPSLSALAKAITGSHCNGFLFFRLTPKGHTP